MTENDLLKVGRIVTNALRSKNSMQIYSHRDGLTIKCEFNSDKTHRYILTAKKNKTALNQKTACAIMFNPSYANSIVADKSVNFLEQFILENKSGLGDFVQLNIVNLFSEIQTTDFKPNNTSTNDFNEKYTEKAIEESDVIVIAWGSVKGSVKSKRVKRILSLINRFSEKRIYKTLKHPSIGSLNSSFIVPFRK